MYINKIEEFIDIMFDDFNNIIVSDGTLDKLVVKDFAKFQKKIDEILYNYFNEIDLSSINKLLQNNVHFDIVHDIFKKYIALYLFISIGLRYNWPDSAYINNIVEISNNQSKYKFKVRSFFLPS